MMKKIINAYAKFNNKTIEEYEKNSISYLSNEVWKMLGI